MTMSSGCCTIQSDDITYAKNLGLIFSEQIGGGAFSDVFKGTFNSSTVAIKVNHHKKFNDEDLLEKEKYISELLKKNTHKNIIKFLQIYDNCNKTQTWIIMEWINGEDMAKILSKQKIPFAESVAKDYFRQLIDGLRYLHNLGIVHRDIKTENIVLCKTDNTNIPKYIDFGFAKKVEIQQNKAMCSSHRGTLEYLAPEILANNFIYDAIKSDIYSLGVVLFVMLFRTLPFNVDYCSNTLERIQVLLELKSHLNLHFPSVTKVSEKAKKLIISMLSSNSNKRLSIDQIMASDWMQNESKQLPSLFMKS